MEKIEGFQNEYRWLSNFVPCKIEFEGLTFPSVEHAYVAAKTTDKRLRVLISMAASSAEAKKMGKKILLRPDWEDIKEALMFDFLIQKYSNPRYTQKLLDTGDAYIEETNYWNDTFWGVCNGVGENRLGKLIMQVRELLKEEFNSSEK